MTELLTINRDTIREPGQEPVAGYRLLAPLGRGGFGEVWKCEAPGGLHKAIKFIPTSGEGFRQELSAFEQIKSIRHPFLLTLERVEKCDNDLLMVMELADGQLSDRFRECQQCGLTGIPRDELLGYMTEAAEALDTMGSKYGLQHLDVKPENIFLVAGHAKVGDYGLVRRAELDGSAAAGGFTPKYTPPEVLTGKVDIRSDQYSLALVYAELLTGQFPYPGRSATQIMLQHMQGTPDLNGLPAHDRAVVGRALAKDPAARFPSCLAFVRELTHPDRPGNSLVIELQLARHKPEYRSNPDVTTLPRATVTAPAGLRSDTPTQRGTDTPSTRLIRPNDRQLPSNRATDPVPTDPFSDLTPVMPVARLHQTTPRALDPVGMPTLQFVEAVVRAASEQTTVLGTPQLADEQVRFLSTVPVHMMPYKLVLVAEQWGLSARHVDSTVVILRKEDRDPSWRTVKSNPPRGGYEVTISLPAPPSVEVTASARMFGTPDRAFVKVALRDIPAILEQVRSLLQNLQERRSHPRHPFDTGVRIFPLFTDGQVGHGVGGTLVDVSLGGARFVTPTEVGSDRLFVQFPGVPSVGDYAVYARVLRSHPAKETDAVVTVARFRRGQ